MRDREQLSALISGIYDAALDSSLWPEIIKKCARFVGGSAAALFSKDSISNAGNVYYDAGTDPHYRKLYFDKYVNLDPATTGHLLAPVEQPIATADLMPYEEFLDTRFYREWARPQGLVDFVSAVLEKSLTSVAMFGVFRHERDGVVDDDTRDRMRLIVPHIRRAMLIGKIFEDRKAEAASFTAMIDGLNAAIVLVDCEGRIVRTNAAADALLGAGELLRVADGRLAARDPQIGQALRESFAASDGADDTAIGGKGIALPLGGKNGTNYVAHVLPLNSGARRRAGSAYPAAAALFVRKATLDMPSAPEAIGKAYKLTPAELRVLLAIVEVGGVPEVADALGVAATTVKTHLSRLFEKTGASRQADLVKLVAGYSSLLVA